MKIGNGKQNVYEYLSVGGELALSLSVPILVGYWLDVKFETSPWLLLSGILTGIFLFSGVIWRLVKKFFSD